MSKLKSGDRVLVLEPVPSVWQKVGTIVDILNPESDHDCIYEVRLDEGGIRRLRGHNLEKVSQRIGA